VHKYEMCKYGKFEIPTAEVHVEVVLATRVEVSLSGKKFDEQLSRWLKYFSIIFKFFLKILP